MGAIFLPLNFRLSASELDYQINDSEIQTLFTGQSFVGLVEEIQENLLCTNYFLTDGKRSGWQSLEDLLKTGHTSPPPTNVTSSDVAAIFYTSGTTGRPKGAMLTHGNIWANNINWIMAYNIGPNDVMLTTAPQFHVGGLYVLLTSTLQMGGHAIVHRNFDPGKVISAFEDYSVTITFAVPTMVLALTQHPRFESSDFSKLRLLVVGGAPTPESLLRLCQERGIPVGHNYGMTEVVSACTYLETDQALAKINSAGRAMMLCDVAILGSDGNLSKKPGIVGEILIYGDTVVPGYWNRPKAAAAAFTDDGWLKSGDVGYFDDEGYIFVCDRKKDMIISGGENIYPAEIESVLLQHPSILNAAVIGCEDDYWGERVVACLILKPETLLTLEEIQEYCAPHLGRYKIPREFIALDEMPLNSSGKIVKQELREMVSANAKKE